MMVCCKAATFYVAIGEKWITISKELLPVQIYLVQNEILPMKREIDFINSLEQKLSHQNGNALCLKVEAKGFLDVQYEL